MAAQTSHPVEPDAQASAAMLRLIAGFFASRAVYAAAQLGIADHLAGGAKDAQRLAAATATHAPSLERLLRILAALGVLAEDSDRSYALTPLGATLRSDSARSLRAWAMAPHCDDAYRAWGSILHSIETGENAFAFVHGMGGWAYRAGHPEYAALYDQAMANLVVTSNSAVLESYSFASVRRIVDVGGGDGGLLIALLRAHPEMRGVLLDLPHVVDAGRARIAGAGLADRSDVIAGDASKEVPSGADACVISRVIHNWADDEATQILRNCHRALPAKGRVLLIERVLPEHIEPSPSAAALFLADLNMMIMHSGRERTAAEYHVLLEAAGFRLDRVVATDGPMSVIEATRI